MEGWDCIFCVFCALLLTGCAQAQVTPNGKTPSQLAASRKVHQGRNRLSPGELPTVRPAVTTVSASLSLDDSREPLTRSGAAVENDLTTPRSRRKDRRGHKTSTSGAHGGPDRLSETRDAGRVSRLTDATEFLGTLDVIPRKQGRRSVGKSQREKNVSLASGSAWNASTENVTSRPGGVTENGSAPLTRDRDPIYWPWGPGLKHNKTSHDKPDGAPILPSPGTSRESNSSSSGDRKGRVFWPWGPNGDTARNVSSTDRTSGNGSAVPGSSPDGSPRGAIPWPWGPADKDRRRGSEAHDHSSHSSDPHLHGTESSAGTSPSSGSAGLPARSRHVHHAEVPELDDVRLADASVVVARAEGMYFIQRLFQRYSGDSQGSSGSSSGPRGGVLTVSDLASLLDSIGFRRAAADKGEAVVATTTPHQHPAHEEPPLYRPPEDLSNRNKGLHVDHSHCLSPEQLLQAFHYEDGEGVDYKRFLYLCPALLYQLDSNFCLDHAHSTDSHVDGNASHAHATAGTTADGWKRWLAGMGAVLVVSLVGLASVFAVQQAGPAVRRHLLPFLVALAVGALSGDALLHLLPHVLTSGHEGEAGGGGHREGVWRGLAALTGLLSFWLLENLCRLFQLRKLRKKQARKRHSHAVAAAAAAAGGLGRAGGGGGEETKEDDVMLQIKASPLDDNHADTVVAVVDGDSRNGDIDSDEHHGDSHGHAHAHGHAHSMPEGLAAILSMVVLGDGIHNLLDGLAIGAAFAAGLTSGLSTALAVLCHELPHEIGDFAMLLSAGMPVRRALLFNCVSSLLCLLGCGAGLGLGNMAASLTAWLLAAVAGLFLYIALVTMLPQLKEGEGAQGCGAFLLRMSGILTGAGIMLTIAIFEEQLKTLLEA